jgi:hypothetical protein
MHYLISMTLSKIKPKTIACINVLACILFYPPSTAALPGESPQYIRQNWKAGSRILDRPNYETKLDAGYPDLISRGNVANGHFWYTLYLGSDGKSREETIDYRPFECAGASSNDKCEGKVVFQKNGNRIGHDLIEGVFGSGVLNDFVNSTFVASVKGSGAPCGIYYFYSGYRYNFITWTCSEGQRVRLISQFSVLVKNDAYLRNRIARAKSN